MARRITTGVLGGPILGNLRATSNLITAARLNENLALQGNGTGIVEVDDILELRSQNSVKLYDLDNSASINIKSPEAVTSTVDLTLPNNTPLLNYVLTASDANGNLEWRQVELKSAVDLTTNDELPVYFGDTTTADASGVASISTLYRETDKFSYNPFSNRLTVGNIVYQREEIGVTTSRSLLLSDRNKVLAVNAGIGATITITIPLDTTENFPIGSIVYIARVGNGTVTLAAAGGVTSTKTGNLAANEELYVRKRAANSWVVVDQPRNPIASGGAFSESDGIATNTFTTTGSSTLVIGA